MGDQDAPGTEPGADPDADAGPAPADGNRSRLRAPGLRSVRRWGIGVVGTVVTLLGPVLVPFPGPGWLIVFLGLGILATEFAWAKRLVAWGRAKLDAWTDWLKRQPWWIRGLFGLFCLLLVAALVFAALWFYGLLPGWLQR